MDVGCRELSLFEAAAADDLEAVIERLSESDTSVDIVTHGGVTALHLAASRGNFQVAKYLLDCGADANLADAVSGGPRFIIIIPVPTSFTDLDAFIRRVAGQRCTALSTFDKYR